MIPVGLTTLMDATRSLEPSLYRRSLAIFLDGMRGDRGQTSELPVAALGVERAGEASRPPRRPARRSIEGSGSTATPPPGRISRRPAASRSTPPAGQAARRATPCQPLFAPYAART